MERDQYIQNNDLESALLNYRSLIKPMDTELIDAKDCVGRVLAKAIYAKVCDPVYNASAMDGIAVISEKTLSASEINPLELKENDFTYVNTGNPVLPPFDSVIMIEDVIQDGEKTFITSPSTPWQHVRCVGETVVSTEMVLPSHHKVRALDLGAILASGNPQVEVYKKPLFGVIPTGNEMVESTSELKVGKLMESNSHVFCALLKEYGAEANRNNIVLDNEEDLKNAILKQLKKSDAVIINAGSSAGTKDFTSKIIASLGQVVLHGLAIKPGKPTILGIIDGKPVIGVPGYPVSAYIVMEKVVKEVVETMIGLKSSSRQTVKATLTKRVVSSFKNEEFVRVTMGEVDGKLICTPLNRGAAAVMSMVKADGLINIERNVEGIEAGDEVEVELYRPLDEIKKNLVIIGSHDVVLDVVSDKMPVSSAHVGSMGGILALKANACHVAPIHLLDGETGEYNISFIKKYFDEPMVLIKGLGRTQCLITEKGNPKNILSLSDLKKGYSFANRQKGAGTRLLFDYQLQKLGIYSSEIKGYDKEYTTHLAVASAVKNGVADCGLAVISAAKIMDLEAYPIANEEYDFLIKKSSYDMPQIKEFIATLTSQDFKDKVNEIGGYTFDRTGEVIFIG